MAGLFQSATEFSFVQVRQHVSQSLYFLLAQTKGCSRAPHGFPLFESANTQILYFFYWRQTKSSRAPQNFPFFFVGVEGFSNEEHSIVCVVQRHSTCRSKAFYITATRLLYQI
jgi:hypothetical protein